MSTVNDEIVKERISQNIQRLLADRERDGERGSKYWLAQQTGEWESTIGNIVNGRHAPGAGLLKRIADALGVSTEDLYAEVSSKRKKLQTVA